MRVTTKGQVTIPRRIRERLGITAQSEVEFVEERGRVFIRRGRAGRAEPDRFERARGVASVKMTTDQILRLTRGAP